jgi:hypothetical protein
VIVDYIHRYLAGTRTMHEEVLAEAGRRFVSVTHRQFMSEKAGSTSYHPSAATKCPRANYGQLIGAPAEPFDPQTLIKFWTGDLLELGVLALAQLAFKDTPHSIGQNNAKVDVPLGTKRELRTGYIDGLLNFNHRWHREKFNGAAQTFPPQPDKDDEYLVLEVKSMDSYPFELFSCQGQGCRHRHAGCTRSQVTGTMGPDDTFGYRGQTTVYQRALEVRRYIMVAVEKGTGALAEHVGVYEREYAVKADAIYDQVMAGIATNTPPPVPDDANHGADPRDGKLRLNCRFCARREWCFGLQGLNLVKRSEKGYMGKVSDQYYAVRAQGALNLNTVIDNTVSALGGTR